MRLDKNKKFFVQKIVCKSVFDDKDLLNNFEKNHF